MNGNCHLLFGTSVSIASAVNLPLIAEYLPNIQATPEMTALIVLGGIVGCLLPDMDNPSSYVGKLCVPISRWIGNIHKLQGKADWQHRGILHDGAIYLGGLLFSYFCFTPLLGLFLGGVTHCLLDMFNPSGIPFLFGIKRLRLGKIASGSSEAVMFTTVCTLAVIAAGVAGKIMI